MAIHGLEFVVYYVMYITHSQKSLEMVTFEPSFKHYKGNAGNNCYDM
jgi:hypothetical protein